MKNKHLDRIELLQYVHKKYGTNADYPWSRNPNHAVLRHKKNSKWYGLIMNISKEKLGIASSEMVDILNVKCDPVMLGSLLLSEGFFPAYHMSKSNWVTILLDGTVPDEDIMNLLDISYKMTENK